MSVYPRWRGEHCDVERAISAAGGLSPLARGTRGMKKIEIARQRFIPAGAGNTHRHNGKVLRPAVYPRWRGEHNAAVLSFAPPLGLSPLARGTQIYLPNKRKKYRFIPAGAGNTHRAPASSLPASVYPRWRGEHHNYPSGIGLSYGLSPLARGTRCGFRGDKTQLRFIPAGAGNTLITSVCRCSPAVYPRWRGEHRPLLRGLGLA